MPLDHSPYLGLPLRTEEQAREDIAREHRRWIERIRYETCPECGGEGTVEAFNADMSASPKFYECLDCGGSGEVRADDWEDEDEA